MDVGDHTQGGHRRTGGDLEAGGGHTRMDSGHHTQSGHRESGSDPEAGIDTGNDIGTPNLGTENAIGNQLF